VASPVYSNRLLAGSGASSYGPIVVADGFVVVIRDLWWTNVSNDGSGWALVDSTGCVMAEDLLPTSGFTGNGFGQWTGRQVIEAGDSYFFESDATSISVRISGYSLTA
jgi:hypothetical protein